MRHGDNPGCNINPRDIRLLLLMSIPVISDFRHVTLVGSCGSGISDLWMIVHALSGINSFSVVTHHAARGQAAPRPAECGHRLGLRSLAPAAPQEGVADRIVLRRQPGGIWLRRYACQYIEWCESVAVAVGLRRPGAAAWSEEAYRGRALDEDGPKCSLPFEHLGAERPVIAVGAVDAESAARPTHRTDERCEGIHSCLRSA